MERDDEITQPAPDLLLKKTRTCYSRRTTIRAMYVIYWKPWKAVNDPIGVMRLSDSNYTPTHAIQIERRAPMHKNATPH